MIPPPMAVKKPKTDSIHGDARVDEYHWLREKESPEVVAYLNAENAYTDAMTADSKAFEKTLYDEMLARIQETDLSVPYQFGGYFYYTRTEEGRQYPIYCRKHQTLEAEEEVTLDVNALAEGHAFASLGVYAVSDDAQLLAYTLDVTGFREYTLYVKNLATGEMLSDKIEKVNEVVWAADNKTLFYTQEDAAKRPYCLYRHALGAADDALVFEETDALYHVWAQRSRSRQFVFFGSSSSTADEVKFLPADAPDAAPTLILARELEHEYSADHRGELFYIRTNKGATNFRLVTAPVTSPGPENWTELVAHRPAVMLENVSLFADHAVISEREDALPHLNVLDLTTNQPHRIAFDEAVYSVYGDVNRSSGDANPEFETKTYRFRYQSFVTPSSVYDYDMDAQTRVLLKQTPVLGGYDSSLYVSERLWAIADDGARVPISLVSKKGVAKPAPLLLSGYGSYGISSPVAFNSNRLSLLDRGVIFAVAHIRGGGEMGKAWHDAGKMKQKQTTFTDFIACAEHLVREKYTSPEKLIVTGGSAGGLLMGAVTNMKPELMAAVVSYVPFVDVLNTMLDDTLPLTVGEYLEWGNPNVADEYAVMKTYCPYTNLEAKSYPALLVKTSLNDSQVMYWEPAKYVAKLRTLKTDTNPLLLKTNMGGGHGGSSGRYDALKEVAFDYAWMLGVWGI